MTHLDVMAAAVRLEANARAFEALLEGVTAEQARWKPSPDKWSILEVVNHLADEEAEDFRQRLDLTLHRPGEPWPPIDPQGWPASRGYHQRELPESLRRFVKERRRSLEWLKGLGTPDWERSRVQARSGRVIRVGDLLASWLDHDLIHLRQIVRLHHEWLVERAEPYRTEYAGGF